MKYWIRSLALLAMITGVSMGADARDNVGLGFVLGSPSGLSAKIPSGAGNSINLILGYSDGEWGPGPGPDHCCNDGWLYVGGDYVWYNYNLIQVPKGRLPFYYGPGVWASIADRSAVGIRMVLGLEYQFATAPFDLFLEIGPGIRVVPNTEGDVSAGLGGRFFF